MKLFIAITLFVAVSALPRRHEIGPREESPIVFRHWEPTPSLERREPNEYIRIKNILNALLVPHPPHSEANGSGDRKRIPEDIINALNIIHHILNNNEGDDDDHNDNDEESIIAVNDGEVEDQSDLAPGSEEEAPHGDGPDSDDENIDNESQQSNNDGQNGESEEGDDIPYEHQNPDKNQSSQSENSPSGGEVALIDVVQPENEENLEQVGENDPKDERFVDLIAEVPPAGAN